MAEFAYNNANNASICLTSFKLNCDFYPQAFYKEDINLYSKSKSSNNLATKLTELMAVWRENLQNA